jgi:predicted acyltransferase
MELSPFGDFMAASGSLRPMAFKQSGTTPSTGIPLKQPSPPPPAATAASPAGTPPKKPAVKLVVAPTPARLVSLDAFRGLIMTLLAAGGFGIFGLSRMPADAEVWKVVNRDAWERVAFHFEHPHQWRSNFLFGASTDPTEGNPWQRGAVSMWDLIQPSFMFMVGVAMPFSALRRKALGDSKWRRWRHAIVRAIILVLMGVFLYSLGKPQTNWIFPNVLAQIGLGYLFAFAVLEFRWYWQVAAMAVILLGVWGAFWKYQPPKDLTAQQLEELNVSAERGELMEPPVRQWSKNLNVAQAFDVWFLNQFPRPLKEDGTLDKFVANGGGYQTLNFVPSIATTILGVLCGGILLSGMIAPWKKVGLLLLIAILCYLLGMAMGVWGMPIVKRIWTPSWTLFSGGFVVTLLALFYVLFDIFPFKKLAFPLVVVGVNSILMYLMGELIFGWVRDEVVRIHFRKPLEMVLGGIGRMTNAASQFSTEGRSLGEAIYVNFQPIIESTAVFAVFWIIAFTLYRKRLFLRI